MKDEDNRPTWEQTFMEVARTVAKRSKDPRTKVGAVLVKNNCILATGYNGEQRGFLYAFDWSTPEKYDYVIHAEMNAIANAVYNGAGDSIRGSEIYLTLSPCSKCMLMLIQFGVAKVHYSTEYKDFELAKKIADHSGIILEKTDA